MTAILRPLRHFQFSVITLIMAVVLIISTTASSGLADVVLRAIADAYIQVTSFVAATLFIFYGVSNLTNIDLEKKLARSGQSQIIYAALLGALPGCGGAIIVITQYVTGRLSFGAVTAVLTATMGDAAFLLIAQEPTTGFALVLMGFLIGVGSGYIVDAIHGEDFLRQPMQDTPHFQVESHVNAGLWLNRVWVVMIVPGFGLGILTAFQINPDVFLGTYILPHPTVVIGALGGVLSVLMFAIPKLIATYGGKNDASTAPVMPTITSRIIGDTNFVTAWVVMAFLLFEVSVYLFGVNLNDAFRGYAVFAPLVATLLGFIPGCGPQILVTTLYLSGAIPLSAQISNSISNDGDALFPAIAIAPKVAIVATLYSAIPALLFGYAWFFLVEGG